MQEGMKWDYSVTDIIVLKHHFHDISVLKGTVANRRPHMSDLGREPIGDVITEALLRGNMLTQEEIGEIRSHKNT